MTYTLCILKDGETIVRLGVTPEEALDVVGRAIPKTSAHDIAQPPQGRELKGAKPPTRAYRRKPTQSEEIQSTARRHPATEQIEDMLIDGMTTAAIMERVEVSPPTIGVIRTRLRKEGRLTD